MGKYVGFDPNYVIGVVEVGDVMEVDAYCDFDWWLLFFSDPTYHKIKDLKLYISLISKVITKTIYILVCTGVNTKITNYQT